MTDLPDAQECRERALIFAKHSATCASPEARARFASIAKTWIALAFELAQGDPGEPRHRLVNRQFR